MITKIENPVMDENKFWELVAMAKWPSEDHDKVKIRYLKALTKEECQLFRKMESKAYGMLANVIEEKDLDVGLGNDSGEYLISHIIGLGKDKFYRMLNNPKYIQSMSDKSEYQEGFSYCIPYDEDYEGKSQFRIEHVIYIAKESLKEIEKFRKMDKDGTWLKPIDKELKELENVFLDFLLIPDNDALKVLVEQKGKVEKHCKKIEKYFNDNEQELPRKFTDNGMSGICVHIFNNTICDAELLLEYLKD